MSNVEMQFLNCSISMQMKAAWQSLNEVDTRKRHLA